MNIEKVISNYIDLSTKGDEYIACCPFHNEKTPSFTVVPDRGFFCCFGCGASGDAIEFVKKYENLGFKDALSKVASILGVAEEDVKTNIEDTKARSKKEPAPPLDMNFVKEFIKTVGYKSNNYRGIRDEISRFFGHLTRLDAQGNVLATYYPETNDKGQLVGYKCRNHPKDFSHGKIGEVGSRNQLAGQVRFKSGGKYVLLVGGEIDMVSAYQMLADSRTDKSVNPIPVVSPTTGENCVKQVAAQYEWFDTYDIIVIGLDNDAAGREATKKLLNVLPKEKVRVATWSGKDPNQMLLEGKSKQFVRDFYNAKEVVSSGIASSVDAIEGIEEFLTAPKVPLPPNMHRLQKQLRGGIKSTGSIVNIIAHTSTGKCLGVDTPVLMYDTSIKKVQDVVVGDLLMGDDGTPREVLSLARGREMLYRIDQEAGMSYVVNESHILSLRAGYDVKGSKINKGDIVNINIKDYLSLGYTAKRSLKGYKGDLINLNRGGTFPSPWLVGLWLADGNKDAPLITINSKDLEILERLQAECLKSGYKIKEYNKKESCSSYYISGGFKTLLQKYGLLYNKHIPKEILDCDSNTRLEFLAGILDGDGYKTTEGFEIIIKNNYFAETFINLVKTLGLTYSSKKVTKSCQNNFTGIYNRIFIYGRTERVPLTLTRKKCTNKSELRLNKNTAITVTALEEGDYYGFSISGNRLFCLGDCTVTHNTLFTDSLIYYWIFNSPITPVIVSLERTKEELLIDIESMHLNKNLQWFSDGYDAVAYRNKPEVKALLDNLYTNDEGKPRFYIIEEREATAEDLKKQMKKANIMYDASLFIIDPLTDFLRSLGTEVQEDFMMWQKQQKKLGSIFINVLHTRKPTQDKEGKEKFVTEYDALGSGSFVQSSDINIVLNRDKMSPDDTVRNTTIIDLPKARGGVTGRVEGGLFYDVVARRQYDLIDYQQGISDIAYSEAGDTDYSEDIQEFQIDI